jgi:transcription initiation factor TFIID TATA-box-binding protein
MRIREPKATALVFRTGKLIVTGLKTLPDSETSTKKFVAIIQKAGFQNAKFDQYQIQNMTATCNAGFPISLEGLMLANSKFATYEPELFPGLIYRMTDPKICLLIFVSGKVVITGAKSTDHLTMAISKIYNQLFEFRKKNTITLK